jgi:hypothetical protein|eukprot:COSAG06_NODE_1599_length_8967_cov_46.801308_3_plen_188_part_00
MGTMGRGTRLHFARSVLAARTNEARGRASCSLRTHVGRGAHDTSGGSRGEGGSALVRPLCSAARALWHPHTSACERAIRVRSDCAEERTQREAKKNTNAMHLLYISFVGLQRSTAVRPACWAYQPNAFGAGARYTAVELVAFRIRKVPARAAAAACHHRDGQQRSEQLEQGTSLSRWGSNCCGCSAL